MQNQSGTASSGILTAITSQYPLIYIVSWEEERLEKILQIISRNYYKDDRMLVQWTSGRGFFTEKEAINDLKDPQEALQYILDSSDDRIYLMKDLPALFKENSALIRTLRDVYDQLASRKTTIVMSYPVAELPEELKKEVYLIELGLPTAGEIFKYLTRIYKPSEKEEPLTKDWLHRVAIAMKGLSLNEVRHLFRRLLNESMSDIDHALTEIYSSKSQILLKEACLKLIPKSTNLRGVGGLDILKNWVTTRRKLFTKKASDIGMPLPSGVLLMGISGCGKSLAAKTISSVWDVQLMRLDMNLIMSGSYGSPEMAFDRATRIAESIAPVILWIDEIENSFGYDDSAQGSGNVNIFSAFLTWMQEKPSDVFVAATANKISKLPAEMIRKGRFDQVFFLDLPQVNERQDIFKIHIEKNQGNPKDFALETLAKITQGWNGAEIEQAVKSARVDAFTEEKHFTERDVLRNISNTVPLSETMYEQVNQLRKWSINRATPASSKSKP